MEVSAMPPMPLDFSMVRNDSGSPGGGLREESPRPVSNSAFRVVTPKDEKRGYNSSSPNTISFNAYGHLKDHRNNEALLEFKMGIY
ncbi:hypothetical protein RR46_03702 [Papilio xuthus]|uniref:Uncharacterized protein n=1 Tax=Papilio xuthus TaxID=66420 RepID=A0A194Q565_PAPXU|nr:hypothetical protein RR46_03702 [Papilio xuthus]